MSDLTLNLSKQRTSPSFPRFRILVTLQIIWMVLLFVGLEMLEEYSFERYYVCSYFGLVVFAQLFAPQRSSATWWRRTKLAIFLGFFGLCYFLAVRVMDVLQL